MASDRGARTASQTETGVEPPARSAAVSAPTPEGGLDAVDVLQRRSVFGPNTLPGRAPATLLDRVVAQLRDPMILLLLGAAGLSSALHDFRDVAIILLVVVTNTAIGVGQEVRAQHALDALRALSQPTARIWRSGCLIDLPTVEVVPGDRIVVEAGDIVAADATLVGAAGLEVDESALTGESRAVEKSVGQDTDERLLAGTVVTRGRGTALVTATGVNSAIGGIAALLGHEPTRPTPLQDRLRDLGRILAATAVALAALVMALGLLRGRPVGEMTLIAISLAVAAVPESLPAVVTLALALGARRMSRRAAIVRRLSAVETLGAVTVFLTDKTGTLTQNRMTLERAYAGEREYGLDDISAGADEGLLRLLRDVALCNDADLAAPDQQHPDWWPRGEATDVALLSAALTAGVPVQHDRVHLPRVGESPFDSQRKRMTTIHRTGDDTDEALVICKGAPEVLLAVPGLLRRPAGSLQAQIDQLTDQGLRVLMVAEGRTTSLDAAAAEQHLDIVGLVALNDPPRADARAVLDSVREAGIAVAMVTGDHPDTARAVAERLGLGTDVVTGTDLERGDVFGDASGDMGRIPAVFARTRPEQKYDIVTRLQARGHIVAMTGDGVNDAPALERADIGVAMGMSGTEVAKQAADLILTDDSLGTVAHAIDDGRRIYANIRTFLRYALAGGVAEVGVMLFGPFVGIGVPLLPGQILWINLLTHGLPGLAFGAEPGDPEAMHRPPRSPQASVLGNGLWRQVLLIGALIAVVALTAGLLVSDNAQVQRSAVFLTLGLAQLGVALALRRRSDRRHVLGFLDLAVASSVVLQLAAVFVPWLAELLGTRPLPLADTAVVLALGIVPGVATFLGAGGHVLRDLRLHRAELRRRTMAGKGES
ncbi:cation-translocating P-type ATPase [Nocardioides nematodiphilus]|uniref:cation-translocating P-type ATPase n=1 Tax=Nocardioides nematodiphilus TaxID=2849669 RepID=UPI001CDA4777|nr:cation-transporting P-type ATPase [Nocardioides nematodiphilus]MCA1982634.1 cation-transporting P-type ATPase [Nocardioides nematodiphilus]